MLHLLVFKTAIGQEILPDSIQNSVDTSIVSNQNPFDTVQIEFKDDELKAPVKYEATDSIVYDIENEMLYLYGNASMDYQQTNVKSERVTFDWKTQTLSAEGVDSAGKKVGKPILTQEGSIYDANKMEYNFKTQKGKVYDAITEQDGAYIHSAVVKKNERNEWLSYKTKYTTCNNKEHPHFYIAARRAKIIPNKLMVSGAADLVVSGVNTPLLLPFAMFPLQKGRRSGIILPKPTQVNNTFGLADFGYYWAVNDNLSLQFTSDVILDGTFQISLLSNYIKRYRYGGNLMFSYRRVAPSEPYKANAKAGNEFKFNWNFNLDNKASKNNSFSANVNVLSGSYESSQLLQNRNIYKTISTSHVNYIRTFNGKPFTFTAGARVNQNLHTKKVDLDFPELQFSANSIKPFKSKISSSKPKFYEKIRFNYNAFAKASVSTFDSLFFTEQVLQDINYGINQTATINATYSLFKYFNITPSFNYNEQWFFRQENIDYEEHYVATTDTTYDTLYTKSTFVDDFFARRNFSAGISLNTTLTGIYTFKKGKVKAIKHLVRPTIGYNYNPDFKAKMWGYYNSYYNEHLGKTVEYNQFTNKQAYGGNASAESNSISFSIDNTIEMKVKTPKDTVNRYKKVLLLKSLRIGSSYNFAADSFQLAPITISATTTILKGLFGLTATARYDIYSVDKQNNRINKTYWETDKKPLRFKTLNITANINLRGKSKNKNSITQSEYSTEEEREFIVNNPYLYYDFNIPWSLRLGYHMTLNNGIAGNKDKAQWTGTTLSLNGDINITPKWKVAVVTGYQFDKKQFSLTRFTLLRNLHCWEMSLNWQAYPTQTFQFEIRAKSALLQDLKLTRKNLSPLPSGTF